MEMRAYIIAVIEDTRDIPNIKEDDWKWGQIELKLADCNREVSFDFDLSTADTHENSLYKIGRIAEVINAFHEALKTEAESIAERQSFTPNLKAMSAVHLISRRRNRPFHIGSGRQTGGFQQTIDQARDGNCARKNTAFRIFLFLPCRTSGTLVGHRSD